MRHRNDGDFGAHRRRNMDVIAIFQAVLNNSAGPLRVERHSENCAFLASPFTLAYATFVTRMRLARISGYSVARTPSPLQRPDRGP